MILKDSIKSDSSVSSMRITMYMSVLFSMFLSAACLYKGVDPSMWFPIISMFFLGSLGAKTVQRFGEVENKPIESPKVENGGQ